MLDNKTENDQHTNLLLQEYRNTVYCPRQKEMQFRCAFQCSKHVFAQTTNDYKYIIAIGKVSKNVLLNLN